MILIIDNYQIFQINVIIITILILRKENIIKILNNF